MTRNWLDLPVGPARARLEQLSRRAKDLPADVQDLIQEILEAFAISVEELQVAAEELYQQNAELQASREETEVQRRRYRDLFEFAPDGYLVTDPAGVITDANRAAVDLVRVSRQALEGKPLVLYIAPDDRERFHRQLDRLVEGHSTGAGEGEWELQVRPRHGPAFPAAISVTSIRDTRDRLTGLLWLVRDISASKRAEERERLLREARVQRQAAEEANRVLQALINALPIGAIIADADGNLLQTNAAGQAILGATVRGNVESPERPYTLCYPDGTTLPSQDFPLKRALEEGRVIRDFQMLIRRVNGEERILLASAAPVSDEAGQIVSGIVVFTDITERQRLLDVLREERARFATIFDNAPEAILVADPQGRILLANEAAQQVYRRPVPFSEPFQPHESVQVLHPDGRSYEPEEYPILRAVRGGELVHQVEMTVVWDDGFQRDLLVSAAPLHDGDGGSTGAVSIIQDISELAEARRAIERYARRLNILHQAGQAILSAPSERTIVETVLPFVRQLVPCQRASVLAIDATAAKAVVVGVQTDGETQLDKDTSMSVSEGGPLKNLIPGEISIVEDISTLDAEPSMIQVLQAEGVRAMLSVPLMAQDELLGALNLAMEEPIDLTGHQRQAVLQMADQLAIGLQQARLHKKIQHQAQHLEKMVDRRTVALRASEARFRTIFEDSNLGMALLDTRGQIVTCNAALQGILSYHEQELCGTSLAGYSHPDDAEADRELYEALASGELGYYQVEKRYVRKDGQVRWCELTVSRLKRLKGDEQRLAIAMVEDITEKRMSQAALLRAERLAIAGRLGASLAHEINNPLQAVIGSLGLAEEMLDEGVEVRRYLEIAMEELERAAGIVTQLRDLGRAPKMREPEPADLNELVDKVLLLTRKDCRNRGIEVTWNPVSDLPAVPLLPERMRQVFLNLILNAIESMPHGGQLQVSAVPDGDPAGVRVAFADTGLGIEPERLATIFEPFHSTRPEGLGLGLYISKNIVEEHGGHIDVDSHVGEGTTFTVWLPA